MRAVSLPRFLQSQVVSQAGVFALLSIVALLVLLALGVSDVNAAQITPPDYPDPFRW